MDFGTLEKQLFDWEERNGPFGHKSFYKITLSRDLGEFPSGSKFDWVYWDDKNSFLQLGREGKYYVFHIKVLFERISEEDKAKFLETLGTGRNS